MSFYLVYRASNAAEFSAVEHLDDHVLRFVSLAGVADNKPGDCFGASSCSLLRVPIVRDTRVLDPFSRGIDGRPWTVSSAFHGLLG